VYRFAKRWIGSRGSNHLIGQASRMTREVLIHNFKRGDIRPILNEHIFKNVEQLVD
jgi:hypothetical protein